jgi:hypothetical protein
MTARNWTAPEIQVFEIVQDFYSFLGALERAFVAVLNPGLKYEACSPYSVPFVHVIE